MLKLQQLKEKQKQQQQQQQQQPAQPATTTATPTETPSSTNGSDTSSNTTGYVLKRQNSKELAEQRRQKSKESNVFTLRSSVKGKKDPKKKKANAAELRAHKDVTEMEPIPGTRVEFPDPDNLMTFYVYVTPSDGLYKGAEFKFTLVIPNTYPYDPPKATCDTMIYHPNIDWEGHVCLNILRAEWMPVLNLGSVIFGLEPNPDDPLNKEAAQLMIENRSQFEKNVKQSLQGGYVVGRQFPKLLK